jgi:hypothetical protein
MDVKSALTAAVKKLARHQIDEFTTWPVLNQFKAITPDGEAVTVKPDGFVRIHEKDADGSLLEHTYFLEVDRSSEVLETLSVRAACYLDYYRRGGLAVRNGRPPEEFKDFPFRVLMVFKSAERRNNMAERLLQNIPPILTQVWLTTLPEICADPLGPIWIRPIDYREGLRGGAFDLELRPTSNTYRRASLREETVERIVPKHRLLA